MDEETSAEKEQEVPKSLVTHVNNILHSIWFNVEVYTNSQKIYNSNGLYAHKSYHCQVVSDYKGVLHCRGYTILKSFLMEL